jgi:hypothetical protein
MPRSSSSLAQETKLNEIITCLNAVLPLLHELIDAYGTPFLSPVSDTTLSLVSLVQVRAQQNFQRAKLDLLD